MMEQVNKLFAQNQELLVSTLYNREQYIEDERAFSEHIYELEREKEKLSDQIYAAEKALQQDCRRKGALWRGTHKILKLAGLSKRKDSNARPEMDVVEDIEKDCNIVPLTRENRMSLEVNSLRNGNGLAKLSHANIQAVQVNPQRNGSGDLTDGSYNNSPSHRSSVPSVRNGGGLEHDNIPHTYRGVQKNGHESPSRTPPLNRHSKNNNMEEDMHVMKQPLPTQSTPIQKVFVTQLTTPQIMKASPDGMTRVSDTIDIS